MKYDIVFWDWNGTLIDDCGAALECVNEMLDETGDSHIDMEKYYSLVDTPIKKFYIGLYGTENIDFVKISRDFHDSYDRRIPGIKLMENAIKVLEFNKKNGIAQIIITSSHTDEVKELTKLYGIDGYFTDIIGASDKFATGKAARAVEYFGSKGFDRSRALFVGDTLHDVETAEAIGIDCVLTSKGHQGENILRQAGCLVIDDLTHLKKIIEEGTQCAS